MKDTGGIICEVSLDHSTSQSQVPNTNLINRVCNLHCYTISRLDIKRIGAYRNLMLLNHGI